MFRSRFFLSSTTKLTLYYTLIYPYIVYCNCAWSSTYVSNLNRIYYLQKRAVRAITNSDYRAHSAPLFSKLGILDIFQVNTFEIAKFMFYYRNNLLPPLLLNLFVTIQIHNYGTRTASSYRTHLCRTKSRGIYNSLPKHVLSNRFSANRERKKRRKRFIRFLKSMPLPIFPLPDCIFALPFLFSQISPTQSFNPVP